MLSPKIVKHLKQLQEKKYRREYGEFVVEGFKGVEEALRSGEVILVVVEGSRRDEEDIAHCISIAQKQNIPLEFCANKDIGSIKTTDTFPGILAVVEIRDVLLEDYSKGPIIALESINDPGNLGTIIRTADWFGLPCIILSENSVDEYNPKVVRSTMGSIFRTQVYRSKNFLEDIEKLKKQYGYSIVSLDITGKTLPAVCTGSDTQVFLFGSESHGLSSELEKLVDIRYTIPGKGKAESLNVAVAAGILMSRI